MLRVSRKLVSQGLHELRHVTGHYRSKTEPKDSSSEGEVTRKPGRRLSKRLVPSDTSARRLLNEGDDIVRDFESEEAEVRFLKAVVWPLEERKKLRIGKVTVRVVEAAYLPWVLEGSPSPYCVVEVEERGWQSKTIKRHDSPTWHEEPVEFYVSRHDAIISVQVLDEGETHDDRLGFVDIKVADLGGLGTIRRWYPLKDHLDSPAGSIHLHISYEVSAVGEAASRVWIDERPPPAEYPPFDINRLYESAFGLRGEMKPYLDAATEAERILKWTDVPKSRKVMGAFLILSLLADCFLTIVHLILALVLLRNYIRKQQLDKLKAQAVQIFAKIDADGNGEIDRAELGVALWDLIAKSKCECRPTEEDIDNLFNQFANHNHRLELDDLIALLMNYPKIVWGYDKVAREEAAARAREEEPIDGASSTDDASEDLDQQISDAVLERASSSSESNHSLRERLRRRRILPRSRRAGSEGDGGSSPIDGPVKGVARKIINLAGRKYTGRTVAWAMRKANHYSSQLHLVREAFEWTRPKLSCAAVVLNCALAYWHWIVPFKLSCLLFTCLAFFYYTDKRRALAKIVTVGPAAYARYVDLKTSRNLRFDLVTNDQTNVPVIPRKTRGDARDHGLQAVIRGIFSRLDADGDGVIDAKEMYDFCMQAVPRATPALQNKCSQCDDPQTKIRRMLEDFNNKRGADADAPIDLDAVTQFVIQDGGCATLLLQDELRRQLDTVGVRCVKLPSKHDYFRHHGPPRPHVFGAHQTLLTLRGQHLRYTNRRGYRVSLSSDMLVDIKVGNSPHLLNVLYRDASETKTLVLSLAPALRRPLLELLLIALRRDTPNGNNNNNNNHDSPAKIRSHFPRLKRASLKPAPEPPSPRPNEAPVRPASSPVADPAAQFAMFSG